MINYGMGGQYFNPHALRVGITKDWDLEWYKNEDISEEIEINPKSPINRIGKIRDWDEER